MIPNLSLADGVVEIIGDNGAHYFAYVTDVYDPNDPYVICGPSPTGKSLKEPLITLQFENNWRPKEAFPLSRIRLPTNTFTKKMVNGSQSQDNQQLLTEGTEAEVYRAMKEGHECGLWKCVIKMVKDDFYGVSYGSDDKINCKIDGKEFNEIVTKNTIRPISPNPYLTSNPFFKFLMEVPKDLLAMNPKLVKRSRSHKHFRTALSLVAVNYDDISHRLICIGFALNDKRTAFLKTIKGAEVLAETHFKALKMEAEMQTQIEMIRKQFKNLDEIIKIKDNELEVLVRVEEQMMRYAIGTNGSNIKKVLQMPGVLAVDRVPGVEENVFRIIATNRNSLRVAKQMLQIQESVINIPFDLVPHIIGKKGALVQEMTDKSGLISIKIKGHDSNIKSLPFQLIGTKDAIENATLLLTFQINCLKETQEMDKIFASKRMEKRRSHK